MPLGKSISRSVFLKAERKREPASEEFQLVRCEIRLGQEARLTSWLCFCGHKWISGLMVPRAVCSKDDVYCCAKQKQALPVICKKRGVQDATGARVRWQGWGEHDLPFERSPAARSRGTGFPGQTCCNHSVLPHPEAHPL